MERRVDTMFGMNKSSAQNSADPWPLRFRRHNFGARCYNTLKCRVIYNRYNFSRLYEYEASGVPQRPDWKESWDAQNIIGDRFAPPVQADWTSLDGSVHHAEIDLATLFDDRLVLHRVAKNDIPEGWLAANVIDPIPADILMEINDRTISVYMKAHVTTKEPQELGNPRSCHRTDLILAWSQTY